MKIPLNQEKNFDLTVFLFIYFLKQLEFRLMSQISFFSNFSLHIYAHA